VFIEIALLYPRAKKRFRRLLLSYRYEVLKPFIEFAAVATRPVTFIVLYVI
jgi:hypothetical protein